MHPTAVLLALRGCRPVTFNNSKHYMRVVHRLERNAPALYLNEVKIDAQTAPQHYTEVAWDDIADVLWDGLLPSLIAEFLETL